MEEIADHMAWMEENQHECWERLVKDEEEIREQMS